MPNSSLFRPEDSQGGESREESSPHCVGDSWVDAEGEARRVFQACLIIAHGGAEDVKEGAE
jgi:hypothetical protein